MCLFYTAQAAESDFTYLVKYVVSTATPYTQRTCDRELENAFKSDFNAPHFNSGPLMPASNRKYH